jgi:hypothetical protein
MVNAITMANLSIRHRNTTYAKLLIKNNRQQMKMMKRMTVKLHIKVNLELQGKLMIS